LSGPEVVDVADFLKEATSKAGVEACKRIAKTLKETSCLIIRDPRVSEKDNSSFIDLMEKYWEQPRETKMKDVHPELHFQVGATPDLTEHPRDHTAEIKELSPENSAHVPTGPDPKWRFFWRIGDRPKTSKFPELNAPQVIPKAFEKEWPTVMNKWGELMMQSVDTVAEMLAVGLDLPKDSFVKLLKHGPHLLAPTGSNFNEYNKVDTILAGFHYDLNFLTIHGKSRFPGLYIWLRDGTKVPVKVPDGCLLLQAGKQLEWVTGGEITAGFHEVVISKETVEAIERAKREKKPIWRVSSTLFSHVASDEMLKPFGHFDSEEARKNFPPTLAGHQVEEELKMIKLAPNLTEKH
jgi:isopenicillin N synthase-like dioxygenase